METAPKLVRTTDGHLVWRTEDGRFLPVIRGAQDDGDPGEDPGTGPGDGGQGSGTGSETGIPQSKVQEIAAREKAAGKRAREKEIAEELGMSIAEVKAMVEARKAAEDATKSEAERALETAKAREAEANRALEEAKRLQRSAVVVSKLAEAGAPPEVAPMIDPSLEDPAEIASAVEELKTRLPALFTAASGPSGYSPPNPPSGQQQGTKKKPLQAGRERALARLGKNAS